MSDESQPPERLSRRTLLAAAAAAGGAAMVGGLALTPGATPAAPEMRYRTLGRTGLKVSEIGFGGYPIDDPEVLVYALERGINYVDTAHCYRGGASEKAIAPALKGRRDQFVLTTKWCPHHIGQPATRQVFLDMLDKSLLRLGTDHVDIVLNHEVGRHSDGERRRATEESGDARGLGGGEEGRQGALSGRLRARRRPARRDGLRHRLGALRRPPLPLQLPRLPRAADADRPRAQRPASASSP